MAGRRNKSAVDPEDLMNAIYELEKKFMNKLDEVESKVVEIFKTIVNEEINKVRKEFMDSLKLLEDRLIVIEDQVTKTAIKKQNDISLNIVIRNLEETNEENTLAKVNGLIKDKLKLGTVKIDKADRKNSFRDDIPGVIIAKCVSKEDKDSIMKAKSSLNKSTRYKRSI